MCLCIFKQIPKLEIFKLDILLLESLTANGCYMDLLQDTLPSLCFEADAESA
jgi:hypothetical protein